MCYLNIFYYIKTKTGMVISLISFVIIIVVTSSVWATRCRLVQHRTTRQSGKKEIPNWLNSKIDSLFSQVLIWKVTSVIGIVLLLIRLSLIRDFQTILVVVVVTPLLVGVSYFFAASITSQNFSEKIRKQYNEDTLPECF